MTPWLQRIVATLMSSGLEAVFVRAGASAMMGESTPAIDLLVRDTPAVRVQVRGVALALGCTCMPPPDVAPMVQLVGGALPIVVWFGRAGAESFDAARARAAHVGDALVAS